MASTEDSKPPTLLDANPETSVEFNAEEVVVERHEDAKPLETTEELPSVDNTQKQELDVVSNPDLIPSLSLESFHDEVHNEALATDAAVKDIVEEPVALDETVMEE